MRPIRILKRKSGAPVQLFSDSVFANTVSPTPATGTLAVNSAGTVTGGSGGTYSWLPPGGVAANYEIRATLNSSSGVSSQTGTYGSFLALSSNRSWSFTRSSIGTCLASVLLEIRPAGGGTVLASCTISFDCEQN